MWAGFFRCSFWYTRTHSHSKLTDCMNLTIFLTHLLQNHLTQVQECFVDFTNLESAAQLCILIDSCFLKRSLLKWKFPWWEVKIALICGYNDNFYGLLTGFIYPWLKLKSIAIVPPSTIILMYHVQGGLCFRHLNRGCEEMKRRLSKSWSQVACAFPNRVTGTITRNLNPLFMYNKGGWGCQSNSRSQ